jgi:Holliday junction resolvasome RuvABC endonuclease subunit
MNQKTILGIDPGTRYMGMAVIAGPRLLAYGVHQLRNGREPHDLVGQAKAVLLRYVRDFAPIIVAIERPLLLPTKTASLLSTIGQELRARATALGCQALELDAKEVRHRQLGKSYATKLEVAVALARQFPQLAPKVPKPPDRAALGWSPKDRYWLHMFDALAVAKAAGGTTESGTLGDMDAVTATDG